MWFFFMYLSLYNSGTYENFEYFLCIDNKISKPCLHRGIQNYRKKKSRMDGVHLHDSEYHCGVACVINEKGEVRLNPRDRKLTFKEHKPWLSWKLSCLMFRKMGKKYAFSDLTCFEIRQSSIRRLRYPRRCVISKGSYCRKAAKL